MWKPKGATLLEEEWKPKGAVLTETKEPAPTPIMEAIREVDEPKFSLSSQINPLTGKPRKVFEAPTEYLRTKEVPEVLAKRKRPRWDEFIDATARGLARVGAAGYQAGTFMEEMPPLGAPGMRPPEPLTPRQIQSRKQSAMKLRKNADFLWRLSQHPELAARNKDLASKALNLIGETIPYITATTAGYVTLGPVGAFTVGSMVEGNTAYRTAVDFFKAKNKGKPLTPKQENQAKKIGAGVGVVAGAVEAFGGKYAEQLLLKATAKLKSKLAKAGAVFGIGTVVEALEEGAQEVAAITGEETYRDVNWNERVSRTLGAMAGGGFLGGAMRGGSMAGRGLLFGKPPTEAIPAAERPTEPITKPEARITPDRVKSVAEKFSISEERARTILEKQAALRKRPLAVEEKITPIIKPEIGVEKPKVRTEPVSKAARAVGEPKISGKDLKESYQRVIKQIPSEIAKDIDVKTITSGTFTEMGAEDRGGRVHITGGPFEKTPTAYHIQIDTIEVGNDDLLLHELLHAYVLKHPELAGEGYFAHEEATDKLYKEVKAARAVGEPAKTPKAEKKLDKLQEMIKKQYNIWNLCQNQQTHSRWQKNGNQPSRRQSQLK